jgi:N utilization substance protein B
MAGGGDRRWEGKRRAREAALRMLYQAEVGQMHVSEAARHHDAIGGADAIALDDAGQEYAGALAKGSWLAKETVDAYIAAAATNWRLERIAVVDRLVLRLAVYEMLEQPATPPRVVIDEAIELARAYCGDDAARFVNGVLDGVFTRLKQEGKVVD